MDNVASSTDIPIIVTVIDNSTDIQARIDNGVNAITFIPPTAQNLFQDIMAEYSK